MSKAKLKVLDKVVCTLNQKYKGTIVNVFKEKITIYNVEWDEGVPADTGVSLCFGWQLKKT